MPGTHVPPVFTTSLEEGMILSPLQMGSLRLGDTQARGHTAGKGARESNQGTGLQSRALHHTGLAPTFYP